MGLDASISQRQRIAASDFRSVEYRGYNSLHVERPRGDPVGRPQTRDYNIGRFAGSRRHWPPSVLSPFHDLLHNFLGLTSESPRKNHSPGKVMTIAAASKKETAIILVWMQGRAGCSPTIATSFQSIVAWLDWSCFWVFYGEKSCAVFAEGKTSSNFTTPQSGWQRQYGTGSIKARSISVGRSA